MTDKKKDILDYMYNEQPKSKGALSEFNDKPSVPKFGDSPLGMVMGSLGITPFDWHGAPAGEPPASIPKKGSKKLEKSIYKQLQKLVENTPPNITDEMVNPPEGTTFPKVIPKDTPPPIPSDAKPVEIKSINDVRKAADKLASEHASLGIPKEEAAKIANKVVETAAKESAPAAAKAAVGAEAESMLSKIVPKTGGGKFKAIAALVAAGLVANRFIGSKTAKPEAVVPEEKFNIPKNKIDYKKEAQDILDITNVSSMRDQEDSKRLTGRSSTADVIAKRRNRLMKQLEKTKAELEDANRYLENR